MNKERGDDLPNPRDDRSDDRSNDHSNNNRDDGGGGGGDSGTTNETYPSIRECLLMCQEGQDPPIPLHEHKDVSI